MTQLVASLVWQRIEQENVVLAQSPNRNRPDPYKRRCAIRSGIDYLCNADRPKPLSPPVGEPTYDRPKDRHMLSGATSQHNWHTVSLRYAMYVSIIVSTHFDCHLLELCSLPAEKARALQMRHGCCNKVMKRHGRRRNEKVRPASCFKHSQTATSSMERVYISAAPNVNPAGTITRVGPMIYRQMLFIDYLAKYDEGSYMWYRTCPRPHSAEQRAIPRPSTTSKSHCSVDRAL